MQPQQRSSASDSRRTEADLRNEHLEEGAILIQFILEPDLSQSRNKQQKQQWRKVEKKGFRVTVDGCLIPHSSHWFEKRAKICASSLTAHYFNGASTDSSSRGSVNEDGWPTEEEYSHRCHLSRCCSPVHVNVEPRWVNRRRNYCRGPIEGEDKCDCAMEPHCVRRYHPKGWFDATDCPRPLEFLTYDTPQLKERLQELLPGMEFRIRPGTFYRVQVMN